MTAPGKEGQTWEDTQGSSMGVEMGLCDPCRPKSPHLESCLLDNGSGC